MLKILNNKSRTHSCWICIFQCLRKFKTAFTLYHLHLKCAKLGEKLMFLWWLRCIRDIDYLLLSWLFCGAQQISDWNFTHNPTPVGWDTSLSHVNSQCKQVPNCSWMDWANVNKVICLRSQTLNWLTTVGPKIVNFIYWTNTYDLWNARTNPVKITLT